MSWQDPRTATHPYDRFIKERLKKVDWKRSPFKQPGKLSKLMPWEEWEVEQRLKELAGKGGEYKDALHRAVVMLTGPAWILTTLKRGMGGDFSMDELLCLRLPSLCCQHPFCGRCSLNAVNLAGLLACLYDWRTSGLLTGNLLIVSTTLLLQMPTWKMLSGISR
jgi:hypothetical protein